MRRLEASELRKRASATPHCAFSRRVALQFEQRLAGSFPPPLLGREEIQGGGMSAGVRRNESVALRPDII